jgi:hypothetical protein
MLRRVVHRSRPITSQISDSGVFAATSSASRSFSATVNRLCISHLLIGSNPIRATVALIP